MKNLLPANEPRIQKQLTKYKGKTEFSNGLRILRYTRGLKVPKGVRRLLDWCAEMSGEADEKKGVGAFYYKEDRIAKEMNVSLSTVEKAIRWLKKHGFLFVIPAWNYNEGRYGTAYKVFADVKSIGAMVQALVNRDTKKVEQMIEVLNNQFDEIVKKFTGSVTGSVTGSEDEENPITPTDETPKNSTDKRPKIKDQDKNIKKNNTYNTYPCHDAENPQQSGRKAPKIDLSIVHPKTFELLKRYKHFADYPFYDNDLKLEMTFWIQKAIDKAGGKITDPDHQHVIKEAIGTVLTMYGSDKPKEELTKLMYASVKEILEQLISGQRETAATAEKPKQKKPFWKKGKKPIRTEKVPEWSDRQAEESRKKYEAIEQEQREANERMKNDPVYAANAKKELEEMMMLLGIHTSPQNAETAF